MGQQHSKSPLTISNLPTTPFLATADISDQPTIVDIQSIAEAFRTAAIGSLLDDRYRINDVKGGPGKSGMGVVYLVETDDARYAAKSFQQQFARNLPLVQRFLREARTWILTGFHQNIVHAYFLDIVDAVPYLFMEYVETDRAGRVSLADHLRSGPLKLETAMDWAIQCCAGMTHATQSVPGLVHRDLKPENLLITPEGVLKISDFGLVRCRVTHGLAELYESTMLSLPTLTQVGSAFGTPAYMAPEQFMAADEVRETADIYSFGCCFYEAISGTRIFTVRADSPVDHLMQLRRMHQTEPPVPLRARVRECPQDLDRIIMQCVEKLPEERWQSFEELHDQLIAVYEHSLNRRYEPRVLAEPSPEQVGQQLRSLTLLDGYSRAVRLQDLRDNQDSSPYAFHLALASYFRSAQEVDEERRQLDKALRASMANEGHDAARRLAELLIQQGEFSSAKRLLDSFLQENPGALETCLEPLVHLHILRQEFDAASQILDRFDESLRTDQLRATLYRAQRLERPLEQLWRRHVDSLIASIARKISEMSAGDRAGWEFDGDRIALTNTLAILAPDCNTSIFESVEHATWPDMTAYPDFSSDMAWLSHALGELAEAMGSGNGAFEQTAQCATLLGYPDRLARHLARDETWFWSTEVSED